MISEDDPIRKLLKNAFQPEISDLFLTAGKVPFFRRCGKVTTQTGVPPVRGSDIETFRKNLLSASAEEAYQIHSSADAAFEDTGKSRFRLNFFESVSGPSLAARPVRSGNELFFERLHLPETLRTFCMETRGLILVSGTTGSGKSTTIGAMVNCINRESCRHILTIEDPVEFLHQDERSLVSQREIGDSADSFAGAMRSAVRENPDVIVIGEMRDPETVRSAVAAAVTGHLVISTVHASDTVQTVERIISLFPEDQREQAAQELGSVLTLLLSQRLIPAADGSGMLPVVELLPGTPTVRKLITERDFRTLDDVLARTQDPGFVPFTRAAFERFRNGEVKMEPAQEAAGNKGEFALLVKGMESGSDTFRSRYGSTESESSAGRVVDMRSLLRTALKHQASDLILTCGTKPTLRLNGELRALDLPELTPADVQELLFSIISRRQRVDLEEKRELDLALSVKLKDLPSPARFRVNGFYQRGAPGAVIRVVNTRIPLPDELCLPPSLTALTEKKQGLILVTRPTGSGKSTTLASLIDLINRTSSRHVITLEDPIEYVHENRMSIIEQREVGSDTLGFSTALKFALRQNPDVIMVGEMRDIDTIAAALTAAETGHLVLATIHTNNAPQTVDRIVDSFPTAHQNQIRMQLAGVLLGVISQRLLPRTDGTGRVAAFEVMIGTPPVQAIIREGRTHQLQSVLETSWKDGMSTLAHALEDLYSRGLVPLEEIRRYQVNCKAVSDYRE